MAVRFDAAADRLLRTTDLLDYNAAYTWMGWVQIVVDLNAFSTLWGADDNSTNNIDWVRLSSDGTTLLLRVVVAAAGTSVNGTVLSVGAWYHVAVVRESATSLKLYLNGVLDVTNTRDVTGRAAATRMEHGAVTTGNTNPSDSRVAAIKAWSANLTQEEVQAEMCAIRPQRTANLYGWWPGFAGSGERARDYSGNVRDWTEGGTLTDEDGAPISWGAASTRLIVPLTLNGAAAITEAGDSVSAAAALAITGSTTLTQDSDALTSAAVLAIFGTAGITQVGDTLTSAATVGVAGVAAMTEAGDALTSAATLVDINQEIPVGHSVRLAAAQRTVTL